jgi:hypothetical protein
MTSKAFALWLGERRANHPDMYGRQKYIYVDNYVGHNTFPKAETTLLHLNAIVWNLPPNSTHLCQPCDSFVISKIKDAWTKRWKQSKLQLIINNKWMDDGLEGSSRALKNPKKPYFFQLAADVMKDVNVQCDKSKISYARKEMT